MYLLFLCGGGSSKLTMNNMRVLSRSTLHLRMTMCTRWRSARSPIPHLLSIYRDLRTAKLPYRGGRGVRKASEMWLVLEEEEEGLSEERETRAHFHFRFHLQYAFLRMLCI